MDNYLYLNIKQTIKLYINCLILLKPELHSNNGNTVHLKL